MLYNPQKGIVLHTQAAKLANGRATTCTMAWTTPASPASLLNNHEADSYCMTRKIPSAIRIRYKNTRKCGLCRALKMVPHNKHLENAHLYSYINSSNTSNTTRCCQPMLQRWWIRHCAPQAPLFLIASHGHALWVGCFLGQQSIRCKRKGVLYSDGYIHFRTQISWACTTHAHNTQHINTPCPCLQQFPFQGHWVWAPKTPEVVTCLPLQTMQ